MIYPLLGIFSLRSTLLLLLLAIFTSATAQNDMKKVIYTEKAPAPIGPYSQAIEAGGFVFISGQIAIDPATGNFESGRTVGDETRQVMENLRAIIEASGCTMEQIVKCTIFLDDMKKFADMNAVYGEYFKSAPPARETVAAAGLPRSAQVEISVVVRKGE